MTSLEEDPIIGEFFNTPEKKARWVYRLKIAYILWIIMVVLSLSFLLLRYFFQ